MVVACVVLPPFSLKLKKYVLLNCLYSNAADFVMVFRIISAYYLLLPATLHAFGMILLALTPQERLGISNKMYYINLSLAEFLICSCGIAKRFVSDRSVTITIILFQYCCGFVAMYLVMISLTVDRFLRVYLNIRFSLYWSDRKTLYMLLGMTLINVVAFTVFATTSRDRFFFDLYCFPLLDVLFVLISTITYTYIFLKIQSNRRTSHQRHNNNPPEMGQSLRQFPKGKEFLSIFLLVISFFIFSVTPDIVYFYHFLNGVQIVGTWKEMLMTFMYGTSYTVDFFIYTFGSKPVRQTLKAFFDKVIR